MKFDSNYKETIWNRLGDEISLRCVRASDKEYFSEGIKELSPVSIYNRFRSVKTRFTDSELRYLTEVDGQSHFCLVAFDVRRDLLIGVARGVLIGGSEDTFDCGLIVADCMHKTGIGRQMMIRLVEAGLERGYTKMVGEMFTANTAMFHLIDTLGYPVDWLMVGSDLQFEMDLVQAKNS